MFPDTTSVLFLNTSRVGSSTTLHSLFQYLCWIRHIWTYPINLFYPDPLQCFSAPKQISTLIQLCFMWKYNEDTLNSFINIFDKNIKQDWAPKLSFGNAICYWLPAGFTSIEDGPWGLVIQPGFLPNAQYIHPRYKQKGKAVGNNIHISFYPLSGSCHKRSGKSRQNLPFINLCCLVLITWLSSMCCEVVLKMICSMIFPGTKVRLTDL